MRLKEYLKNKYPDLSSRVMKRAFAVGACTVNGRVERLPSREINPEKDEIIYHDVRHEAREQLVISAEKIIFEDNHILIYDKDGGFPCLPTHKEDRVNLFDELKKFLKEREGKDIFLKPAHRIDKDTSGLMLFAKSAKSLEKLFNMFREKEIHKEYEALVDGEPKKKEGLIEKPLKLISVGKGWQRWSANPKQKGKEVKEAATEYKVVKTYDNYSHVKLIPRTGRMHQLRVHMTSLGHPILGDGFYSQKFSCGIFPTRHLLHASNLNFQHPMTGKELRVFAPLPDDFTEFL